jgi:cysteine sulfinate desulfinase/cysteine desulfurase-like protein
MIRFSLGAGNTAEEIKNAIGSLQKSVRALRA